MKVEVMMETHFRYGNDEYLYVCKGEDNRWIKKEQTEITYTWKTQGMATHHIVL